MIQSVNDYFHVANSTFFYNRARVLAAQEKRLTVHSLLMHINLMNHSHNYYNHSSRQKTGKFERVSDAELAHKIEESAGSDPRVDIYF